MGNLNFNKMSKIELIQGDCLEKMKEITDKSIDMILCDLPYGTQKSNGLKWDIVIPFDKLWEQYNRIIKDNGAIVLFGSEPFSSYLRCSNMPMYRYDWVWDKNKGTNFAQAPYMPLKNIENICVFSKATIAQNSKNRMIYNPQGVIECNIPKKGSKANNFRPNRKQLKDYVQHFTNYPKSILNFNKDHTHLHPTQKPVALLEYLIKTYTNEGELVLDNCMGAGSTGVACVNTNRSFIGIELDENYFNIAKERIENSNENKQLNLFDNGNKEQ